MDFTIHETDTPLERHLKQMAYDLIGCDYGRRVHAEKHPEPPCMEQASKRIYLHVDAGDTEGTLFQFCPRHASYVMEETDTRTGPIADAQGGH